MPSEAAFWVLGMFSALPLVLFILNLGPYLMGWRYVRFNRLWTWHDICAIVLEQAAGKYGLVPPPGCDGVSGVGPSADSTSASRDTRETENGAGPRGSLGY